MRFKHFSLLATSLFLMAGSAHAQPAATERSPGQPGGSTGTATAVEQSAGGSTSPDEARNADRGAPAGGPASNDGARSRGALDAIIGQGHGRSEEPAAVAR